MQHIAIKITAEQRANFKKLADYLATGETAMKFDMTAFCTSQDESVEFEPHEHDCGTVGCALGHGPAAGISSKPHEGWEEYSERCFVDWGSDAWEWCFAGEWQFRENTPKGAAARIYYMLEHGLPKDWRKQMVGYAPLCYEVPA